MDVGNIHPIRYLCPRLFVVVSHTIDYSQVSKKKTIDYGMNKAKKLREKMLEDTE